MIITSSAWTFAWTMLLVHTLLLNRKYLLNLLLDNANWMCYPIVRYTSATHTQHQYNTDLANLAISLVSML